MAGGSGRWVPEHFGYCLTHHPRVSEFHLQHREHLFLCAVRFFDWDLLIKLTTDKLTEEKSYTS